MPPPPLNNVENTALLVEGAIHIWTIFAVSAQYSIFVLGNICSATTPFDLVAHASAKHFHTNITSFLRTNAMDDGVDDHDEDDGYVGEDEHNADDDDGNHDGDSDDGDDDDDGDGDDDGVTLGQG